MSSPEKFLSICIPTFNQPAALETLLDALGSQLTSEVEILVCDDSTTPDVKAVVDKHLPKVPIRYFRGPGGGLDMAVINLVEQARGRYIWWIGDDMPLGSAVSDICEVLKQNPKISFLWINSADASDQSKLTLPSTGSYFFRDRDDILEKLDLGLLAFISATIFKRELVIAGLSKASREVGTALTCMHIVLTAISYGEAYFYFGKPCFLSKPKPPGERRWYNQFQVFGINLPLALLSYKDIFGRNSVRTAISRNLFLVLKAIVVERALGLETGFGSMEPKIKRLFKVYSSYISFYVFLPLLLLPRWLIRRAYLMYRALRLNFRSSRG